MRTALQFAILTLLGPISGHAELVCQPGNKVAVNNKCPGDSTPTSDHRRGGGTSGGGSPGRSSIEPDGGTSTSPSVIGGSASPGGSNITIIKERDEKISSPFFK